MKGKNTILAVLLIICLLVIAVMGCFICKLNKEKKNEITKSANLQEQFNTLSENANKLQEKIDTISNTINPTNTATETNTSTNATSKVENLKKYLKDTDWLKNNVYIQKH